VKSAIYVFAKEGMNRASVQAIADHAGMKQSAIFRHFPNKESLIEGTLTVIVMGNHETVEKSVLSEDTPLGRLLRYGEGNLAWAIANRKEAGLIAMLYYLACVDKGFSKLYLR